MSDATASQNHIDPNRPWIVDEEESPARMNWLGTLFNPTGKSPKLHFTRAWTALFFTGVFAWLGVGAVISILGIAGADTTGLTALHGYIIAVALAITSLCSFVIHSRRLNHAGKISLRALVVLLPVIVGAFLFLGGVTQKAAEYDELYAERAEFLADPAAWRDAQLEERREAQAKAEKERQEAEAAREAAADGEEGEGAEENRGNRGGQGQGGPQGGWNQGPSAENPLPSKQEFIVQPNLGAFYMPIVLMNTLLMIWSLLWVARVPNFGREPEPAMVDHVEGPFG